ncbi:MAG TPA: PTS transporter subunit EIIB, partial [Steroidobacteraceae bacterium]
ALGGAANLVSVDACTTRLRLLVAKQSAVDAGALKHLGARGLVRPSANALQVVVGTMADQVAGDIRSALHAAATSPDAVAGAAAPAAASPARGAVAAQAADAAALLAALGGRANVRAVELAASRLRVSVGDAALIDRDAIRDLGLRGVAMPVAGCVHVIVGPTANATCAALNRLLM